MSSGRPHRKVRTSLVQSKHFKREFNDLTPSTCTTDDDDDGEMALRDEMALRTTSGSKRGGGGAPVGGCGGGAPRDDATTHARPLHRCLEWVRNEGAVQRVHFGGGGGGGGGDDDDEEPPVDIKQTFVVLAMELAANNREYVAMAESALQQWAETGGLRERCAHEVIWTPTKLYADIDMDWSVNADAEATFDRFVDVVTRAVRDRFAATTDVLVLDASAPPTKFSRHLVVTLRDAASGAHVAFASGAHCGAFVRAVEREHGFAECNARADGSARPLCDAAVYRQNNCLRTYGSTKSGEHRPFVALDVEDRRARRDALDYDLLVRSLVTLPRVTDETRLLRVTDAELLAHTPSSAAALSRKRARSLTASSEVLLRRMDLGGGGGGGAKGSFGHAVPATYLPFIESIEAIAKAQIRAASMSDTDVVLVQAANRYCAQRGRQHSRNNVFFVVDVRTRRYKQGCYSPHCARSGRWQNVSAASVALADAAALPRRDNAASVRAASTSPQPTRSTGAYGSILRRYLFA